MPEKKQTNNITGPVGKLPQQMEGTDTQPFLHMLDAFPEACVVVARDGSILEINREAAALLEDNKPWKQPSIFSFVHDDARQVIQEALADCFTGKGRQRIESTLVLPDNSTHDVELTLSTFQNTTGGETAACLIVLRDLSESKRIELDLLRFSNLAHYTVNPIEITDPDGKIIYVNPAFERAIGYPKSEVIGKNPNIFGSGKHSKNFWQKMWSTINSGKVWVGEVENRRRNGEPFFTHILISPIIDNAGTIVGYFAVHRDITEQKNLQQQLIQAQKMESIGLLAAGIAHEVGNPLTSISSLVQIIQRTTHDDFTQEKLELIKSQIARISRIIRDLVDFSRRSSYEVQLTDANKIIREAIEIVRVGKKSKTILFQVELDDTLPHLLLVPDQIEQVFINILINAVDTIHESRSGPGPALPEKGKITVRSSRADELMVITISDNGMGISQDAMPKIFEPFYTTKRVGEGTGLGLWVSYGIVKSFHGNIQVSSTEGEGTTFTITLPLESIIE